jgi:hypothetical protein
VTVFEWLLVLYVRMGARKRGVRLRDLVGGQWTTPKAVMQTPLSAQDCGRCGWA